MRCVLFLDPQEPAILLPCLSAEFGHNTVFTLKAQRYCCCLSPGHGTWQYIAFWQYFCLPSLDEEAELTLAGLCVLSLLEGYCGSSFPQRSVSENHPVLPYDTHLPTAVANSVCPTARLDWLKYA